MMAKPSAKSMTLDEIAQLHGTDKSTEGHGYTQIYERYLSGWRDRALTVLEIGVFKGASVRMWRDYFPQAQVVGIDKWGEALDHAEERIDVCVGNQSDTKFLEEVASTKGPFDLIIDDGAHRPIPQKTSLKNLWRHVSAGGFYVIEDIHTSYRSDYEMGWREPDTTVEFLKYLLDDVYASLHKQAVVLPDIESLHFYEGLCVICKAGAP